MSDATTAQALNSSTSVPVNRTSSFTARDAKVYVWLNFTNVQSAHNVTFYWILPNGTQYTNVNLTLPGGYLWVTGDSSLPISGYPAANTTGQWFVDAYIDGQDALNLPFYIGSYVSPLTIASSALSPGQNSTGSPINSTLFYNTTSVEVFSYLLFPNVPVAQSYNVTWDFVTPHNGPFGNINSTFPGPATGEVQTAFLLISGHRAENDTGLWYVLIYLNDNFTSPALVQAFYISAP